MHLHTQMCTHTHIHIHTHTHTLMSTSTHTHTHTLIDLQMHIKEKIKHMTRELSRVVKLKMLFSVKYVLSVIQCFKSVTYSPLFKVLLLL